MQIENTAFKDLFVIYPRVFPDERGYFFESFNQKVFEHNTGLKINFVQDNESSSVYGVLRGLHYQIPPHAQSKLVRVINGEVLDVVVDIRPESPTYGKHYSILLSGENKKQLFVPHGFAHGYVVLSEQATFSYKCDNYYNKDHEYGIMYNDLDLLIDWKTKHLDNTISSKDLNQSSFKDHQPFCNLV